MKKANKQKLALNRETLASLQSDVLAAVAGGNQFPTTFPTRTRTGTSVIDGCPSRPQNGCMPPPTTSLVACGPK
jgi:hypothetical protein